MKAANPKKRWPHLFSHKLDAITAPLWGMNPGGGRFYMANRPWISTEEKLRLIKKAGCTHVEAHDTDILDLALGEEGAGGYPPNMSESEKMKWLSEAVDKYRDQLDICDLEPGMFTMNLFSSDQLFNFGNFGSEVKAARDLAIRRTQVGMEIAQELRCLYVYWNGTNGVDGVLSADHKLRNELTYRAFEKLLKWARRKWKEKTQPIAGEAKVEEPKHKMYTPTTQSFIAMSMRLANENPSLSGLLGVNPEYGHEVMVKLDAAMTYGEAMSYGLLYHTHLNDQSGDPAFDRDHPAGATNLRSLVDVLFQLRVGGYTGLLGIDAQPRPTDTAVQQAATIESSVRRIRWAKKKSYEFLGSTLSRLQSAHDQASIDELVDKKVFGIK